MRILAGVIVLLPLVIGSSEPCPEPNYPSVQECPFPIDPNLVTGKLLGWLRVEVGRALTDTRVWCDPDGDPAVVEVLSGPEGVKLVNRPKTGSYTILWTPRQPMTTALVLRVTDNPGRGEAKSDTGTILIQVLPPQSRRAAKPCGGQPR